MIFKSLFQYRELLKTNVKKEIRGKYKGSWLGMMWTFLNPLLTLLIYSIVFPHILKVNVENYTMYMMIALIPWNFFTQSITSGVGSVVREGNILKKVYFPREIIPISIVTSSLINFFITCIIMFIFIFFTGLGFTWHVILFPVIVLVQYIITLAFTLILSAVTVYVRDVDHFVNVILLLAFYVTPIVYDPNLLPSKFQWVLQVNPMAQLVNAYRQVLYYHNVFDVYSMLVLFIVSLICLLLGYSIFKKLEKNFAEEL